jgi:hypothetical protein
MNRICSAICLASVIRLTQTAERVGERSEEDSPAKSRIGERCLQEIAGAKQMLGGERPSRRNLKNCDTRPAFHGPKRLHLLWHLDSQETQPTTENAGRQLTKRQASGAGGIVRF